ncbi:30S ribosomal protein S5 [Patescibacteria group bacterium]|nr:30S ribosomal protein S5 [Patescibacteria group bacterium]MBU4353269.1 30S ribosomal protein S5 [Patescibacteria group bacterium]MBU4477165.1 30S ribosomal protein S5 [Patescibacteria group bacterium]MCG2698906.1 30S ribosomal protein S5 [Candidatus Parcubacteria bacterium]
MRYNKNHKNEFDQKIIDIRRVARVVAGGRRFSFRVCVVAGNRKGEVGVGLGKSGDTASAIEKAFKNAKKNIIKIKITDDFSIAREVEAKYSASRVLIKPAPKGKKLVAGSSLRAVLDLAGVKNAVAKILSRSKNQVNNARAAICALQKLK